MTDKTRIRKTFGGLEFRAAVFQAPALNRGPFKNLPGMQVRVGGCEHDEEMLKADGLSNRTRTWKLGTPVEFGGDASRFYLCYNEDCFDPPVFVVRAEDESEAIDLLLENHPKHFEMSEEDVNRRDDDGIPETVGYSGSGVPYDNEILNVRELEIVAVYFTVYPR